MFRSTLTTATLTFLTIASIFGQSSMAADPVAKKLLTDFWSHTKRKETDGYFFQKSVAKSPESIYAYALVKSRQHDLKNAMRALDALEKREPKNPRPLKLKTWLLLRQDKFDAAMATLTRFITLVNSDNSTTDFARAQAYEFAGKVFGFIDGPVQYRVNEATRDVALNEVLFNIPAATENAFKVGYSDVIQNYQDLLGEKANVDAKAAALDARIQQERYNQLAEKAKQLQASEERVHRERREVRTVANEQLAFIGTQRDALNAQRASLRGTSSPSHYGTPVVFAKGKKRIGVATHGIHSKHRSHGYVHGHYNNVRTQRGVLAQQHRAVNLEAGNQIAALDRDLRKINKAKQRTNAQQLRALKPSGKIVTRSVALKTKSRSIMTYVEFPLEMERQLMLAKVSH